MPATEYREYAPPAALAAMVECFWSGSAGGGSQRVLPDGCADILFTSASGGASLEAVGVMTRFADVELRPGAEITAVRFRPGMWRGQLAVRAGEITDATVALEDLWGLRARQLRQRLGEARTVKERLQLLARALRPECEPTAVQRAVAYMEREHGCVAIGDVAREANLSARQFQRLCVQEAGLTPKLLARVLRFRHAAQHVGRGDYARLAAECGFFDQAHLIAEFKRFAGRTPGRGSLISA